jgi:hypothetical protein
MLQTSDYALINGLVLDDNESGIADVAVLTYMAHIVADVVAELVAQPEVVYPFLSYREEYFHAFHRVVIYSQPAIAGRDVPFVGFVSQRLSQASGELGQKLSEVDRVLIMELAEQGSLLNYSSLQLHDGNWFNLVQFARTDGKEALLATKTHQHAAYELAPQYYRWIRLHHGLIPQGDPACGLELHLTKYYTFQAPSQRPDIRVQQYQSLVAEHI